MVKHHKLQQGKFYELGSGFGRKKKYCPRCGPGTWLAEHSNRITCGRCGFSEIKHKE